MSGRGGKRAAAAREEEEGGADDNFAQQQPPAKKYAKPDNSSSDNSDDIVVCEIGRNRRVTVRNWRGKINVDIREFYPKDGNLLPGKKGLLFPFLFVYFFCGVSLGIGCESAIVVKVEMIGINTIPTPHLLDAVLIMGKNLMGISVCLYGAANVAWNGTFQVIILAYERLSYAR
ncbi:RNA polymerase II TRANSCRIPTIONAL COACTIVATOR [Salix viminalis]|uniref:RNA polymerase II TRANSCRIPTIONAL COACTIVATOR n=1 Tax=Salix viminalis TaxID=40686 RepID=A0A9Q0ZJY9_SALVM|nr:RNA polymerase II TRANSCRIPTIONAL COACTIVATOR [Salix viminalis]